jgi:uncharacterized protein with von Willebrand factor type A (vWA) domain
MPGSEGLNETSDLLRDVAEWRRLSRPGPLNVAQDAFDLRLARDLFAGSRDWLSVTDGGRAPLAGLAQDCWATYYKAAPELVPEGRVDADHRVNRPLLERLLADPATDRTRAVTMLDETAAALAALDAVRTLKEQLRRQQQKPEGAAEGPAAGQPSPEDVRRLARMAAAAADRTAEEYARTLSLWGLQPADLRLVKPKDRLDLARRLTADAGFRRLADLVGRMRNLARARQRHRLNRTADELHGIELGGELGRLLPSELGSLAHPLRRLDLWRRVLERGALQYRLDTRRREGRGPMVVAVDCSGSMEQLDGDGTRLERAKAVAMALVDTARRQRRACAILLFNAQVVYRALLRPGPFHAGWLSQLTELAAVAPSGGTDFHEPLKEAVLLVRSEPAWGSADLVLITDGHCRLTDRQRDEFLEQKQALGLRVCTLLLAGSSPEEVGRWSDRLWQVGRLDDEVAGNLFEEVVSHADQGR